MADTDTAQQTDTTQAAPETVTQQPAPAPAVPEPQDEPDPLLFRDHDKAFFRANIRWLMAELDWARAGHTAEERAVLNP